MGVNNERFAVYMVDRTVWVHPLHWHIDELHDSSIQAGEQVVHYADRPEVAVDLLQTQRVPSQSGADEQEAASPSDTAVGVDSTQREMARILGRLEARGIRPSAGTIELGGRAIGRAF